MTICKFKRKIDIMAVTTAIPATHVNLSNTAIATYCHCNRNIATAIHVVVRN